MDQRHRHVPVPRLPRFHGDFRFSWKLKLVRPLLGPRRDQSRRRCRHARCPPRPARSMKDTARHGRRLSLARPSSPRWAIENLRRDSQSRRQQLLRMNNIPGSPSASNPPKIAGSAKSPPPISSARWPACWKPPSRITVEDCQSLDPISEIGGYRRHSFYTAGQQTLFLRDHSEHGRHDFAIGYEATGPQLPASIAACHSAPGISAAPSKAGRPASSSTSLHPRPFHPHRQSRNPSTRRGLERRQLHALEIAARLP